VHGTTPANPQTVIRQDLEFHFIAKLIPRPFFLGTPMAAIIVYLVDNTETQFSIDQWRNRGHYHTVPGI